MWAHHPDFVTYSAGGEPWLGFEAVRDLKGLPEQILLVPSPGHTHGDCGVAVQGESRWLLDAVTPTSTHGRCTRPCRRSVCTSARASASHNGYGSGSNQDRLRRFTAAHPEVTVFAAHDPGGFPDGQP
jgi:hypothetical protein